MMQRMALLIIVSTSPPMVRSLSFTFFNSSSKCRIMMLTPCFGYFYFSWFGSAPAVMVSLPNHGREVNASRRRRLFINHICR